MKLYEVKCTTGNRLVGPESDQHHSLDEFTTKYVVFAGREDLFHDFLTNKVLGGFVKMEITLLADNGPELAYNEVIVLS